MSVGLCLTEIQTLYIPYMCTLCTFLLYSIYMTNLIPLGIHPK